MKRNWQRGGLALAALLVLSGCSNLFGLRNDLNDDPWRQQPTTGGVWPERGILDGEDGAESQYSEEYVRIGHNDRRPASEYQPPDSSSWLAKPSPELAEHYRPSEAQIREQAEAARGQLDANRRKFKKGNRATRADFIDDAANEASLWASDGQTNYFFTKNSVKSVGDIITINMQDQLVKDVALEMKRNLTEDEVDEEIEVLEKKHAAQYAANDSASAASPTRAPAGAAAKDAKKADPSTEEEKEITYADIDLTPKIGVKDGDTMMAEIIERYPSGNYKIRGTKRLQYRGMTQMLTLVGIVRAADIKENDVTESKTLYEYKLNVLR